MAPSPIVALNRAVALGEMEGPAAALAAVDDLGLDRYHLYHATRGDLLQRLGRDAQAADAFARAAELATNAQERRLLEGRRAALAP
jgi:RNA polymerase sigma-70 factor (ECF subfamily)